MTTTIRGGPRELSAETDLPARIELQAPPKLPRPEASGGLLMHTVPMLGSLGSVVLMAGLGGAGGAGRSYLAAGMLLVATVGASVLQHDRQRTQRARQVAGARAAYLRYLADVRRLAREAADAQRRTLELRHPSPLALPSFATSRSLVWRRSATDPSFLHVRYGMATQPLALDLVTPPAAVADEVDPAAASAMHRLVAVHRVLPDAPASVDLRSLPVVEVCGPEEEARALVRSMVCAAAASHSPDDLQVAVLTSGSLAHWDWVKWLPHALSRHQSDAVGPRRMVTASPDDLQRMVSGPGPYLLLVVDSSDQPPDVPTAATVLHLGAHPQSGQHDALHVRLELQRDRDRVCVELHRLHHTPTRALADQCDPATAEAFARRLAPLRTLPTGQGSGGEAGSPPGLLGMLGIESAHGLDPCETWRRRPQRDRLRVPIGWSGDGTPVHLDLKESAERGMGPHGLVIGATGSGKSELLRTLVLGLAVTHSPEQLNMVLVDFKGGATFAGMAGLPHVSAVITNLAQELGLVDRTHDALSGEMVRRQQVLRAAGNYASVRDYETARETDDSLDPLPTLFVVVDEFSELLAAKPELADLFAAIGRLGRSLGIHLLLASQRLDEGRLRGLESHLSYRICLRTFSPGESRAVIGVADAYELPAQPGLGYLRAGQSGLEPFTAAYVSGPAPASRHVALPLQQGPAQAGVLPFTVSEVCAPPGNQSPRAVDAPSPGSVLEVAVARMQGVGGPVARQVWLPPLDVPDTLDTLMDDLIEHPRLGLVSPEWRGLEGLVAPIGALDRPRDQRRDTLCVNLAGAGGNVAIVGGPRSGKTTLLRTLVTSLALTTTPLESQFFVLDLGGGGFASLAGLPHVAGMAARAAPDVLRRITAEVSRIIDDRETSFASQAIDSIETYRARRTEGRADDGYGDVYVVVDGWGTLRGDFDDVEQSLQQLAGRGLAFGVHLLAASSRWTDFRAAVRDTFGTRLELRLGDLLDSERGQRVARLVPLGRPGRGLVASGEHFLGALPRIDADTRSDTLVDGIDDLVQRVARAWDGPPAPRLRLLPERVEISSLVDLVPSEDPRVLLGLGEPDLAPVVLETGATHLLVYGDSGSGKTTTLRTYLREVMRTHTPEQAQLMVVDYRRSLLGEVTGDHLLGHLASASQAGPTIADLATFLASRLPGPDVTPHQLRRRSWWQGAEVHVVVDDYDLVCAQTAGHPAGSTSPIAPLLPLLAQARDIGLHLVVARRSGGAGRASYEPVLQTLRELATPTLVLSGSPDEGALVGDVRPTPLAPGRGRLWTRERGATTVQVAWTDPDP